MQVRGEGEVDERRCAERAHEAVEPAVRLRGRCGGGGGWEESSRRVGSGEWRHGAAAACSAAVRRCARCGRRASRIVTPVWAATAARAAAEMTTTASRGAPAAPDPAPRSRRMSSSELCWATRTDSADVMQPEQARQSLSVILATPPPSASGRPATPSSCSTARLRPVTGFFWSLTGLTQAADGEMKSSRPSERRTSDIGFLPRGVRKNCCRM